MSPPHYYHHDRIPKIQLANQPTKKQGKKEKYEKAVNNEKKYEKIEAAKGKKQEKHHKSM